MGIMDNNIDLKYVFETYPETEKNIKKLSAILRDLYPSEVRERNLIEAAYNTGVANHLKKSNKISSVDLLNYAKRLEDNYGISKKYSNLAIKIWADVYGLECPKFTLKDIEEDDLEYTVSSTLARFNDVIWENNDIRVIYKGFYASVISGKISQFWQNISLTNKTDKMLFIKIVNMRINEEVVDEKSSEMDLQPNTVKQIEKYCWGNTKDLKIVGVNKIEDVKSLSFEVMYSYSEYVRFDNYVAKSDIIYVEPYYI